MIRLNRSLVLASALVVQVETQALAQSDGVLPKTVEDYGDDDGNVVTIRGPRFPLTLEHVDYWAEVLHVSDEVHHFMKLTHDTFVQQHNAYLDRAAPDFIALSAEATKSVQRSGYWTDEYHSLLDDLNRADTRLRQQVIRIEHDYLLTLSTVLTKEQQQRLPVLRAEATRRNWRELVYKGRWMKIELRPIWLESASRDMATPAQRSRVERILDDYELRLTPLVRRHVEMLQERHERMVEDVMAVNAGTMTAGERKNRSVRFADRRVEVARAVRILHEATLERISGALGGADERQFSAEVKQVVYPEVYPDPLALHTLIRQILNDSAVDDDSADAVRRIRDEYEFDYRIACEQLESFCNNWGGTCHCRGQWLSAATAPRSP